MNRDRIIDWLYEQSVDHFLHWRRHLKEYFWAILVALTLRATVITIYKIPTGSMIPTFREGDWLIANRFGYGLKVPFTDGLPGWKLPALKTPRPGDVVIFRSAGEAPFEIHTLRPKTQKGIDLLLEMNTNSLYPHALSVEPGFTNTIVLNRLGTLGERPMSDRPAVGDSVLRLLLYQPLAEKFRKKLEDPADFLRLEAPMVRISYLTTREDNYPGIVRAILDTPISGACILGTVALNAPFGWALKGMVVAVASSAGIADHPTGLRPAQWKTFSLYPNPWVDMTKDYVKRMIADEGDTVEIINRQVFVNGVPHEPTGPAFNEAEIYGGGAWRIQSNTMTVKSGETTKAFTFPVRQSETMPLRTPPRPFDAALWPYNPRTEFMSGDYSHNFGPITVPKGHVFVMGDNRDNSLDSRFWGFVPRWAIKGQPMLRLWPNPGLIH